MAPRGFPWLVATLAIATMVPRLAHADPPAPATVPGPAAAAPDRVPPHSLPWHEWRLFDPYLSFKDGHGSLALLSEQTLGAAPASGFNGFGFALGQISDTRREHLLLRLVRDWGFRWAGDRHAVVTLPQYGFLGGPQLGPLELLGGVGVGLLQFHFGGGGFGFGALAPRAVAEAALTFGPVRVAVEAYDEYSWLWTNGPSAFVRGVVLEIGIVSPPKLPEKYRLER